MAGHGRGWSRGLRTPRPPRLSACPRIILKLDGPAAAARRPDSLVGSNYSPFASAGTGKPRLRMRAAMPGSRPRNFL